MNFHDIVQSFLWPAITVACYLVGLGLHRITRNRALANPVLICDDSGS